MVNKMTYNQYYLCHHGILGQRWGVRRYQNVDGTLTEAGKKRKQKEINKTEKKKNKTDNIPDYEKLSDEDRWKAKKEAIKTGNIKEANKNVYYYDNKDIQAVLDRYYKKKDLSSVANKDVKTGKQKVEAILENAELVVKAANTGIKIWNTTAKVSNSLLGTDIPSIGDKDDKNKNKKKNGATSKDVLNTANKVIDATNRGKTNKIGSKQNQIDKQKNQQDKMKEGFKKIMEDNNIDPKSKQYKDYRKRYGF